MSASLVGSEMCIRDRCTARRVQGVSRSPPSFPLGLSAALPRAGTWRAAPVSYTHLTLPTM
eukprot:6498611-Alexandrium_andersonii.AAC.1